MSAKADTSHMPPRDRVAHWLCDKVMTTVASAEYRHFVHQCMKFGARPANEHMWNVHRESARTAWVDCRE